MKIDLFPSSTFLRRCFTQYARTYMPGCQRRHFRLNAPVQDSRGMWPIDASCSSDGTWTLTSCSPITSGSFLSHPTVSRHQHHPGGPTRPGRRGSHTTTRELQTCTFERPGTSNTTKIPREDPQRGKKRTNFVAEREKSAKFWASHPSGPPPFGPPTLRAPHPLRATGFGPWLHDKKKQLKKSKQLTQKIQTIKNHKKNN